jgi:hypothetical protein
VTLRELADRAEIEQVLQRYFLCMDTWDYALLDRVFTPDARLRYDAVQGADTTLAAMKRAFPAFNCQFSFMQHMAGQLLIDLDGDTALAGCTLRAVHVQTTLEGGENQWVIYGVYRDRLVRTPDGWRIAERHFRQTRSEGRLLPMAQVRRYAAPPWL